MADGYIRGIQNAAREQGWRVEQLGSGHWQWFPPDKEQSPVVQAHSGSDHRGLKNFLSRLRARGLKFVK